MKRVYLHGGHFKTGTTALQFALARQRPLLARHGVLYPEWDKQALPHQHGALLALWHPMAADQLERDLTEAAVALRAAPQDHIILSAETVSCFGRAAFERFKRAMGPDIELILVLGLRHWAGFSPSRWQQHVRLGDSLSFPEMMARLDHDFDATSDGDFSIIPRHAIGVFDDIRLVPYTRARSTEALIRALDIPALLEPSLLAVNVPANPSADFLSQEGRRLENLSDATRPRDGSFRGSLGDFADAQGRWPVAKAKIFQRYDDISERFIGALENARVTQAVSSWAPHFERWKKLLDQRLAAHGLSSMPADWGADELDRDISYTTLTLSDLDADIRKALGAP